MAAQALLFFYHTVRLLWKLHLVFTVLLESFILKRVWYLIFKFKYKLTFKIRENNYSREDKMKYFHFKMCLFDI